MHLTISLFVSIRCAIIVAVEAELPAANAFEQQVEIVKLCCSTLILKVKQFSRVFSFFRILHHSHPRVLLCYRTNSLRGL
jgi:hypothetical protein